MLLEQKQTPNASRCDLQKNDKLQHNKSRCFIQLNSLKKMLYTIKINDTKMSRKPKCYTAYEKNLIISCLKVFLSFY